MNRPRWCGPALRGLGAISLIALTAWLWATAPENLRAVGGRQTVVFWHFWGGEDRAIVERIVARFNASQDQHVVRAVAMPGNNLDLKLFLAVTGGEPPDLVNQDDPILADWADRGALTALDQVASPDELVRLNSWLFPAARELGTYRQRLYGLCNGLDVRALYYNQSELERQGLSVPTNLDALDALAAKLTPPAAQRPPTRFGFLPNPKLLWAWGHVFGGDFYDASTDRVTLEDPRVVQALEWMAGYGRRYGSAAVSFRTGDQALPGQAFPLLAGRYVMVVDGQWRVRDIVAAQAAARQEGKSLDRFGVCALPPPVGGRTQAGWINGNFFLIPRGVKNPSGAWEFMKFWSGFDGHAPEAARHCAAGGWIPVSPEVIDQPVYQEALKRQPLLATFVRLAASPHQKPRPNVPGAQFFDRELKAVAGHAMYGARRESVPQLLQAAGRRIQRHLDQQRSHPKPLNEAP